MPRVGIPETDTTANTAIPFVVVVVVAEMMTVVAADGWGGGTNSTTPRPDPTKHQSIHLHGGGVVVVLLQHQQRHPPKAFPSRIVADTWVEKDRVPGIVAVSPSGPNPRHRTRRG